MPRTQTSFPLLTTLIPALFLIATLFLIAAPPLFANDPPPSAKPHQQITLVLHYPNAQRETRIWAAQEGEIDFRRQPDLAARCTTAFAATELADHLAKTLTDANITFAEARPEGTFFIELAVNNPASRSDTFTITPIDNGLIITGQGRTGLLYGAYELLNMQGWRWFAPGKNGQIAPTSRDRLILPAAEKNYAPAMTRGRGFYLESVSEESTEMCLWMARNRLNLIGYRPNIGPLANKLGMTFNIGGHIFEVILDPDRTLPSGKTIWQEHQNWYGLPATGIRDKKTALKIQFCVSQPDLLAFLADELLKKLTGPWQQADLAEVWMFDIWGNTCNCPDCNALGNSTDQMLHFLAALRDAINIATADGRLDHPVTLSGCAYEGTSTITGPKNPFPKNLIDAHDVIVFYPINRCYAHSLYDNTCSDNLRYQKALQSWQSQNPKMDLFFGEYYNVSKYEDLPLLFTETMRKDLPAHYVAGCRGLTYMHLPMTNWSVRTLTQNLYARLAWDPNTDTNAFLNEYFDLWYGPFARQLQTVYDNAEIAWLYISQWRNWDDTSVLHQFIRWDGSSPTKSLPVPQHLTDADQSVIIGHNSIDKLNTALATLESLRLDKNCLPPYESRISEDYRALRYGRDIMLLTTLLIEYHEALYQNNIPLANTLWPKIELVAQALDSYWLPISYPKTGFAGVVCHDALTRSQLRDLVRDCRQFRFKNNLPVAP